MTDIHVVTVEVIVPEGGADGPWLLHPELDAVFLMPSPPSTCRLFAEQADTHGVRCGGFPSSPASERKSYGFYIHFCIAVDLCLIEHK